MEREIKFRGQTCCGRWAYGSLFIHDQGVEILSEIGLRTGVDPKTVEQFTGLFDSNGTEIYEGDVFRRWLEDAVEPNGGIWAYHVVTWIEDRFLLLEIGFDYKGDFTEEWTLSKELGDPDWEYYGAIHDNPELLRTKQ